MWYKFFPKSTLKSALSAPFQKFMQIRRQKGAGTKMHNCLVGS